MAILYLIMLLFFFGYGGYLRYHAPQEIGRRFGFKTARTIKSQRNWDQAQAALSRALYRLAILTVGVVIFSRFGPQLPDSVIYLLAALPIVLLAVSLVMIVRQLPD